ncbi:MAG: DHH family phosphoesterase [Clostridiaceae bacterium]|nr:DHH family phosphoesterase [Clostridia bacterium]MDY3870906.1 DHH family phosphoesterase [Clostridiaceae bacterium]
MDKRFSRMTESGTRLTFVVMLLFAAVTWVQVHWAAGLAELVLVGLLYLYYRQRTKRRAAEIRKYVENLAFSVDDASKHSMVNFPLPMAILRVDTGEIIWCNDYFTQISGKKDTLFETHITDVLHGFDTRWIMEGKTLCPYDVELGEQKYQVYGNMVRSGRSRGSALLATLFWVDITEYSRLRDYVERTRPAVGLIVIDSYEELMKNASEAEKSTLTADIDRYINDWAKPAQGIVRRLQRDRYLFIFEQHSLLEFTAGKFSILETIHQVQNSEGLSATLSIGVGKGECSLQELYQYAALGIDMALSRGGDQAVVKSKTAFEFYGGRSKELEKRTKVKSRVMANALMQLIRDSSQVFLMGHKYSDLDSIGACAGLAAAVRKAGRPAYIIVNDQATSAKELIDRLRKQPQYGDVFISEQDAIVKADASSLCVVCDTTRPDMVEGPDLLEAVQRVAVVDHHRRAAQYIENAAISLHETYASSACELVAELLQYVVNQNDILKVEADAMLAGIFLDTKGFTVKTGVRTFEASAFLRQVGADTVEVRKMLSGGLESSVKKYQIISCAKEQFPGISLSVVEEETPRATASQAADELINASDIKAAFVVYGEKGGSVISARSYGQVNVQMVLEKIGGGGGLTSAGAQFPDKSIDEAAELLVGAIEEYLKENEQKTDN